MGAASRQADMSVAALLRTARQGHLEVRSYETATGRRFSKVHRASLLKLIADGNASSMSLTDAAIALGLTKRRMQALLPIICSEASKLLPTNVWRIPVRWVDSVRAAVTRLQVVSEPLEAQWLTLDRLFRYEAPSDQAMGDLINGIVDGSVTAFRSEPSDRLAQVCCRRADVQALWARTAIPAASSYVSAMDAAQRLRVKQEVAYALIRLGFLAVEHRRAGRRVSCRVAVAELDRFCNTYAFARDLASHFGISTRAIVARFAELGVRPVAGPGVNECRQLVFRRSDIEQHGIRVLTKR